MFTKIFSVLWGKFEDKQELKEFGLLSIIFGFIIGYYWSIRITKDPILARTVGMHRLPYAKWISLFFVFLGLIVYARLLDWIPRYKLFYIMCTFYSICTIIFACLMLHPTIGLSNPAISPYRFLGWAWYAFVESFGSIMVALFWSFVADISTPDSAKRGYGLLVLGAQLGGFLGSLFVFTQSKRIGIPFVLMISGIIVFSVNFLIYCFSRVVPRSKLQGYKAKHIKKKRKKYKFLEGLRLLFSFPYLLGIFAIIFLYEIIEVGILDFNFKMLADAKYINIDQLGAFFAQYGILANALSFLCALFGISNIQRRLGLRVSLVILPVFISCMILLIKLFPSLTMVFWAVITSKALNYSLNNPSREQLYIPTSKDAKYKTKAWTDMFGARASKAGGAALALINSFLGADALLGVLISLIWISIVIYLSGIYKKTIEKGDVIG